MMLELISKAITAVVACSSNRVISCLLITANVPHLCSIHDIQIF